MASGVDIIARGLAAKAAGSLDSKADLVNGKVPAEELPSYVDDVVEYADEAHFPAEGEEGKIYVALDTGFTYRWSGSEYVQIGGQDLSNFVTLDTNQTIPGFKIFSNGAKFGFFNGTNGTSIFGDSSSIFPEGNGSKNLGLSNKQWKDGYFSGQVYAQNTFNVINASDIVNNTLTQAQYDLITNGKPTLIKGQLTIAGQNYKDFYVNHLQVQQNGCLAEATAYWIAPNAFIDLIFKISSSKVISITIISIKNTQGQQNASFYVINGKSIEYYLNNVYPYATNSTTTLQYETINNISVSADTTYSLATAPANTYPEYKGYITNSSGDSSIIITLTGVSKVLDQVNNTITSGSTITVGAGGTIELLIQNGKAKYINWGV